MAEEEEIPKSRGTVKWFHDHKGYGFITPDDGSEDLFVHHSSIESDGFRTLREGQLVEFHIALEEERTKAIHVVSIDKNPKSNARIGSKGRYRDGGGNAYGGGDGCYSCGESGHLARDCPNVASGGGSGGDGGCYNCGDFRHMARDCNRGARGGFNGGGGGGCYNCGDYGHMARDCNRGARGGGFNNGGGACYTCGGQGHVARQCPSGRRLNSGGGGGGSGGGGRSCYNCGEDGHFARECPNPTAA